LKELHTIGASSYSRSCDFILVMLLCLVVSLFVFLISFVIFVLGFLIIILVLGAVYENLKFFILKMKVNRNEIFGKLLSRRGEEFVIETANYLQEHENNDATQLLLLGNVAKGREIHEDVVKFTEEFIVKNAHRFHGDGRIIIPEYHAELLEKFPKDRNWLEMCRTDESILKEIDYVRYFHEFFPIEQFSDSNCTEKLHSIEKLRKERDPCKVLEEFSKNKEREFFIIFGEIGGQLDAEITNMEVLVDKIFNFLRRLFFFEIHRKSCRDIFVEERSVEI